MFKPAVVDMGQFKATAAADESKVNNVFKVLHGAFGNLFLSKFSTGVVDAQGRDLGVASARKVWAHGLRGFDEATVLAALEQCQIKHTEYPPSLPQFAAYCRAVAPRAAYRPATPAIGMSQGLRSKYARQAREIVEKHEKRAMDRKTGYVEVAPGLHGLFQAIAVAVGCAGGDEAKELRRLESMFAVEAA